MQIVVEFSNDEALKLLQNLEQLNILRLLPFQQDIKPKKRKWAGTISSETASELHKHVETLRGEWERNI